MALNTDRDMLKFLEAMDAFVRLVLITVIATGTLQIAGLMKDPKTAQALPQFKLEYDEVSLIESSQNLLNNSGTLDNILNIPVRLTSFHEIIENARPAMQRLRELARKRYEQAEIATTQLNRIRRRYHEGPIVLSDGSSSRVLLRI